MTMRTRGHIAKRPRKGGGFSYLVKVESPNSRPGRRKYVYKTARNKEDAQKALTEILAKIDANAHIEPSKISVGDWVETWLNDHIAQAVEQKTFERYAELLRLHIVPGLGAEKLQKLSPSRIQDHYAELGRDPKGNHPSGRKKKSLSVRTRTHIHRVFKQCLQKAVDMGLRSTNPADNVTKPKQKTSQVAGARHEMRVLDTEQLKTLVAGFEGTPLYHVVALAAATGARRGEILALRWRDIDLAARTVRIERALESTQANGVQFKAPKNATSNRTVQIDPHSVSRLRELQSASDSGNVVSLPFNRDSLLFPASPHEPTRPRDPDAVSKEFGTIAGQLGFKGFRFHDLRHTHASLQLEAGTPITTVSQRLGHASAAITLGVYAHAIKRAEDKAVAAAAQFMAPKANE